MAKDVIRCFACNKDITKQIQAQDKGEVYCWQCCLKQDAK